MNDDIITISIELTNGDAWQLAQFCKRVGFSDFYTNAETENQAYQMRDAHGKVYSALRDAGFDPR